MTALLDGILVVDFTQALSGPTLTRYLVELGAVVIKVEIPPGGDITRNSQTLRNGSPIVAGAADGDVLTGVEACPPSRVPCWG